MPCDTRLRPRQTLTERKVEVKTALTKLAAMLAAGTAKAVVGPAGAIAFTGWDDQRAGITDACAYRLMMATGSPLAKQAIAKAEALAGRGVSRQALHQGIHGHTDRHGVVQWHGGH